MANVKICGVTSMPDALSCAELGADFIGNILEIPASPRSISREKSREMLSALPAHVKGVIVMVPAELEDVIGAVESVRPDCIQLHGNESLEFVQAVADDLPCEVIKTIHVRGGESLHRAMEFSDICDGILLDTYTSGLGGSGITHDWELSSRIVKSLKCRVFLAGGLTSENVGDAIKRVDPYCVDASSGVETRPGVKDLKKVENFINASKI